MRNGEPGILNLARERVVGKPFTVSEYNHPAPSDYRVETMPILASFAAAQDWDGFYVFEYGLTGTGYGNDRFGGFFDAALDPVKNAFFPAAALIFRGEAVPVLPRAAVVHVPAARPWEAEADDVARAARERDPLDFRVGVTTVPNAARADEPPRPASNLALSPKGVRNAVYRFGLGDGRAATGAVGFVAGQRVTVADGATFAFPANAPGFAAASLVALDRRTLARSTRALLTLASRAENEGMGWNANRTSVGDRWGRGPVRAEGVACTVSVPTANLKAVWALDPQGRRKARLPVRVASGRLVFRADPKYRTLWYELAAK